MEESRGTKRWNAIFDAVKEVAPDWLGMVPIAGPAIQAGVKTALRAQELYAGEVEEERVRRAQSRHLQFIAALDNRLKRAPLVAVVISRAQWIDSASTALLERVARLVVDKRVVILASYRPTDLGEGHPLRAIERSLYIDDLATRIELPGIDAAAIVELARSSYGLEVAPGVAQWLVSFTAGNPLFVTELLPALENRGVLVERDGRYEFHDDALIEDGEIRLVGALRQSEIPLRVSDALDERIERLDEVLRDLLGIAAVEGARFLTTTLANVANTDDAELLRRLDEAEKRYSLVRYSDALQRRLYRYEFAHLLLHQRIYERLPEPIRLGYHSQIADALVETWGDDAPRPVLLDIARHYEVGLDRPAAARFLLKAAESAQVDGAAPHAASLARRALTLLDDAASEPRPPNTDALRAELAAVLVGAIWENVPAGDSDVKALIAQGRAAAPRSGDLALQARLLHAEGRYVLGTEDVVAAITAFEQAREMARRAKDPVSEFAVAIDLGNAVDIQDINRGYLLRPGSSPDELEEAEELFTAQLSDGEQTGHKNLLVAARSLKSELELRRGRPLEACVESTAAVDVLEASGDLPIVRTEEVLWRHACCLAAAGRAEAEAYFEKARAVVERKAASLEDDEARRRFLTTTPVARTLDLET